MKKASALTGAFGLVMCFGVAFAAVALGARAINGIAESYQPGDILYDEGPQLFQAWLKRNHENGDLNPQSVAHRILIMPISARRDTVISMARSDFWPDIVRSEAERRALLGVVEEGLVQALATAPSAGDLWLAASQIRSRTTGFDKQAETYLRASYLMAPREGDLARLRHIYLSSVGPLLREPLEAERQRDRVTVARLYPAFDKKFQDWLDKKQEGGLDALRR